MKTIYECSICRQQSCHKSDIEHCEASHITKEQIKIDSLSFDNSSPRIAPSIIIVDINYVKYEYQLKTQF